MTRSSIFFPLQVHVHDDEREKVLKRSEAEREAADDEQTKAETYLVRSSKSGSYYKLAVTILTKAQMYVILCHGAVAQLVERPSKVSGLLATILFLLSVNFKPFKTPT